MAKEHDAASCVPITLSYHLFFFFLFLLLSLLCLLLPEEVDTVAVVNNIRVFQHIRRHHRRHPHWNRHRNQQHGGPRYFSNDKDHLVDPFTVHNSFLLLDSMT